MRRNPLAVMAQPFSSHLSPNPSLWHPVVNWLPMVLSDSPRSHAITSGDCPLMILGVTSSSVPVSLLPSASARSRINSFMGFRCVVVCHGSSGRDMIVSVDSHLRR